MTALATPFDMSLPAVSKHLKVLERAGRARPPGARAAVPPAARPAPLREIADWVEHDRRLWEVRFDRLESAPHEPLAKEKKAARKKKSPKE